MPSNGERLAGRLELAEIHARRIAGAVLVSSCAVPAAAGRFLSLSRPVAATVVQERAIGESAEYVSKAHNIVPSAGGAQ
jgi:hypothetical protein